MRSSGSKREVPGAQRVYALPMGVATGTVTGGCKDTAQSILWGTVRNESRAGERRLRADSPQLLGTPLPLAEDTP